MTVISLTRGEPRAPPGPPPPRRRRAASPLARIGGGLAVLVPIVFLSTFITYCLGALSNSNPAATILGQDAATPAAVARLDQALGLDHPLLVQYWNWLVQAVHGNLGRSYFTQIPVSQSISQRLPVDLSIAILAVILAVLIGGTAGTVAAIRRGGWFDRGVTAACSAVSTLPAFVVGIILVVLFAVSVHLFPANGYVGPSHRRRPHWLSHIILPSLALSLAVSADIARQLRTSLVQVLDQNYIVGARVRGLPYRRILVRHALRNASGPALVILGNDFPQMLAGAVAAEVVFSLPGLGQLLLESAQTRDIPVVQGLLLVVSTFVIVVNLVVNTTLNWLYRTERRGEHMSGRRPVIGRNGSRSVLRLPSARIAVAVLAAIAILAAFGSALAPQNPLTINANALFQGPSAHHLLGTDYLGRDVLSRLMAGTRLSVLTAARGGRDRAGARRDPRHRHRVPRPVVRLRRQPGQRRADDTARTSSSPSRSPPRSATAWSQAMVPVGILLAPLFFRVTRAATLEHARAQYVEAAELLGASKLHVIRVHVLRKVLPNIAVTTASMTAAALLAVSFLTFLGIGVQPPTPTWGGILSSDLDYLSQAPWAPFIPGALIAITVGALNALADAFRDRSGAGTLVPADPIIHINPSLERADGDRQSRSVA